MKKKSFIDKIVYNMTSKPKHCVKVRKPPKTAFEKLSRPQDARQEQYNRWSRRFKVYSGSYLPKDEKKLLEKGWVVENDSVIKGKKTPKQPIFFRRKSTNQWVRNDRDKRPWHWYNCWKRKLETERFRSNEFSDAYYDEYGNVCGEKDDAHHLTGED